MYGNSIYNRLTQVQLIIFVLPFPVAANIFCYDSLFQW